MPGSKSSEHVLATYRRAFHDYSILERLEAGVALQGTEVKSARAGQISLAGGYAAIDDGNAVLLNVNIPAYEFGNRFNHDPVRPRRLLLHKREIERLQGLTRQRGLSLIPLRVYLKRGRIKVELGICRGKKRVDRRETLRRKTAEREAQRAARRFR